MVNSRRWLRVGSVARTPWTARCIARSAAAPIGVSNSDVSRETCTPRSGAERVVRRTHRLSLLDRRRDDFRARFRLVPSSHHHRCRWGQIAHATFHHPDISSAQPASSHAGARVTSPGARSPLIASIRPPGRSSGRHQRVSLSSDATARDVTASASAGRSADRPHPPRGRAPPRRRDRGRRSTMLQEFGAAQQRLDQHHAQIRFGDSQRHPRQPRPAADVGDPLAGLHEFGDRRAVQQVAVPQPFDLTRPEQSPLDAGGREQLGVPLGQIDPVTEDQRRRIRAAVAALARSRESPCFT